MDSGMTSSDVLYDPGCEDLPKYGLTPPWDHQDFIQAMFQSNAAEFSTMTVTERLSVFRSILYVTTSVGAEEGNNDRFGPKPYFEELKRRLTNYRQLNEGLNTRGSYIYAMRGQRLCRMAFANLVGLSEQCNALHARSIAAAPFIDIHSTKRSESHAGRLGAHRQILDGSLTYVSYTFA